MHADAETAPAEQSAASGGLRPSIGLLPATALVAGIIIGASVFVQPSEITTQVGSLGGIIAVWLVAGLLTAAGALLCAELASAYPETGGVYVFLRETLSPGVGFLWGWAMFWSVHSGIIAAIAVVFARYVGFFVPLDDAGTRAVAIGAILLLSGVNYIGAKHGGRLQTAFTIGKVAAIALMVVLAFTLGGRLPEHFVGGETGRVDPVGFGRAVAAGLFAFGGWHMVTYSAGETVDARRTIPRALALGVAVVVIAYVALNLAYLYVLPLDAVRTSTRVAADAAAAVVGDVGGGIVSGLVIFSAFGALNGLILAGPRVYWSMARDGLLFRWAGSAHPRYGTPHRAIALQAAWSCVLVLTGTYRALFARVIYTEWIFFALMAAGLMLARRSKAYAPAYRVPLHPVVPVLFIIASALIVLNEVVARPLDSALGLGIVLAGVPVYVLWSRAAGRREGQGTHRT
jgi:basic amino acid/polyamine antiporter, APA family